jgi:hypothetical protein
MSREAMIAYSRSRRLLVASKPRGYRIAVRRTTFDDQLALSLTNLNLVALRLASVPLAWLGLCCLQKPCGFGSNTSGGMGKALRIVEFVVGVWAWC